LEPRTYRYLMAASVFAMSAAIACGSSSNQPIVSITAVLAFSALIRYSRKTVKAPLSDERLVMINEKASSRALSFSVLSLAALGYTLIYLGASDQRYADYGYAFTYAACRVLILQTTLFYYYKSRYGG